MKLKALLLSLFIATGSLFVNKPAQAYTPMLYSFIIDASGSVSKRDYKKANLAVALYLEALNQRSNNNPGKRSEFVIVNWFGGHKEFLKTPPVNANHKNKIRLLQKILLKHKHPNFGSTAIYSAAARGVLGLAQVDKQLDGNYLKIVIVITDGKDTDSPARIKRIFKKIYKKNYAMLFVVGVGDDAQVSEFEPYATSVLKIENYGALMGALIRIGEKINLPQPNRN